MQVLDEEKVSMAFLCPECGNRHFKISNQNLVCPPFIYKKYWRYILKMNDDPSATHENLQYYIYDRGEDRSVFCVDHSEKMIFTIYGGGEYALPHLKSSVETIREYGEQDISLKFPTNQPSIQYEIISRQEIYVRYHKHLMKVPHLDNDIRIGFIKTLSEENYETWKKEKITTLADIFHWAIHFRNEKSIRKLIWKLFSTFLKQSSLSIKDICIDLKIINMSARIFRDPNHVCNVVEKAYFCSDVISNIDLGVAAEHFIKDLISIYGETRVARFLIKTFENKRLALMYFSHSITMHSAISRIENLKAKMMTEIPNTKLKLHSIHDKLSQIEWERKNMLIVYDHTSTRVFEGKSKKFDVRLPFSNHELSLWAKTMRNCLAGYHSGVMSGDSVILGFFENNQIIYAAHIEQLKLIELRGRFNHEPENEDTKEIYEYLKSLKLGILGIPIWDDNLSDHL